MPLKLYPFQKECVQKMVTFLETHGSVYNSCEMGLGKSVQALEAVRSLKLEPVLIICPAVMRLVWKREIENAYSSYKILVIESAKNVKASLEKLQECNGAMYPFVIVSYELASNSKVLPLLKAFGFECLICDEAHYLKSRDSKRSKAIIGELFPLIKYKIALSGTPFTQCVTDGFTIFNAFAPDKFPNYYKFAYRYSNAKVTPWGTKFTGIRNEQELSKIIRERFFIRKTKEEVLPELPDKNYSEIRLGKEYAVKSLAKFNEAQTKKAFDELARAIETGEGVNVTTPEVRSFRQAQGLAKLPPVIDFVRDLLDQDIPVVLFAYHTSVITELRNAFKDDFPSVITGETSSKDRMLAVDNFQGGKTNLFIGQIVAAGVGITLTRSSTLVLAELDYSPAIVAQAIDRCHRIGQKESLMIYYFLVSTSLEEQIINILLSKVQAFKKVLDGTSGQTSAVNGGNNGATQAACETQG